MKRHTLLATSLGNTIEWFDFGLFIFMAPVIGAKFFPQETAALSTMDALMVFAAGFVCRPLGGIFFGHFGDTRGRAKALRLSILMITLSTLLVGLMPSYQDIGILAPVLFTLIRLMQGLSIGGEYSGVMIYLAESAPRERRGFITSFAATGANLGFLLATLSFMLLKLYFTTQEITDWAWRLPFIFAGLPGSLIIFYRFKLAETRVYSHLQSMHHIETQPFLAALKYAPLQLIKILGLTCMGSTFYYVFFGYMPTYLEHYIGFSLNNALVIQSTLLMAMLILVPISGFCGDYFSRRNMLIATSLGVMLFVLPGFYFLQTAAWIPILPALGIATVLSSMDQGNSLTAVVENCPENIRYSGIAFSYNLGMALFGGTAPLIVTLLTDNVSLFAPAYYLCFMASITLLASLSLLPHNRHLSSLKINKFIGSRCDVF